MNNYTEALECIITAICENCDSDSYAGCKGCDVLESKQVLEELIEKHTPKKVIFKNRHGSGIDYENKDEYKCPSCNRRLRNKQRDPYCPRCSQRIDWGDEK